jgi:hypothetical protein
MAEKWKSTNPRDLAYEIATFMGGEWPTRPVRKVQLVLDGAPTDAETLLDMSELNPTLLSEMTVPTRELFLEVYYDDIQDVYSEVMETLSPEGRWGTPLCPFPHGPDRWLSSGAHAQRMHTLAAESPSIRCANSSTSPSRSASRPSPMSASKASTTR